jgi:hypothetical protein
VPDTLLLLLRLPWMLLLLLQIELLLLVGAPAQAFERVASRFYSLIEWIEANCLGWKIPGEEDWIPMYKQIKLYYPQEHAYTFDSYR